MGLPSFLQQIGNRKEIKIDKMGKNLSIATISLLLVLACTNAQQVFDVKSYGAQPNADIT